MLIGNLAMNQMKKLLVILCMLLGQLSIAQNENNIELPLGWSLFGYNCDSSMNVEEAFSPIVDSVLIIKNYLGYVYFPEFGLNTIGNLVPGQGYQIKMSHEVQGFGFCEPNCTEVYVDSLHELINSSLIIIDSLQLELSQYGCIDTLACNYSNTAIIDNSTCEYPLEGYDCDGNLIVYEVGEYTQGGIVFYVNETGTHGLVAALEDLQGNFEWGCCCDTLNGANGQEIGTGLSNTLDIISGCSDSTIAANEALNYESEGFSDWYLPSKYELTEMYNNIGNGSSGGNIAGLLTVWYWSSSEHSDYYAWYVDMGNGNTGYNSKGYGFRVRVIRAF